MELKLRLGFFLGIFLVLSLWEVLAPKRVLFQSRLERWPINLGIIILNVLLTRVLFGLTLFWIGSYGEAHHWGLFHWLAFPKILNFVLGLLLLDWAVWFQHWVFHKVPLLWPLHRVHHTDLDFDVSTGLRFHPMEILISTGYKAGVVLLFGINPWSALVFEIVLNGFSQFTHANVRLPSRLDRVLRWVFVTPDMHRIHHSTNPDEHNQNFGFSFSWWDRLFRTYRSQPAMTAEVMEIGIREFRNPRQLNFWKLILQPFRRTA